MKKLFYCIFILLVICIGGTNVFAVDPTKIITEFPRSITVTAQGDRLTLDSDLKVTTSELSNYAWFHMKNAEYGTEKPKILCTSAIDAAPPEDKQCEIFSFEAAGQEKGVGYIINLIYSQTDKSENEKYWWAEFLVKSYLGKYNYGSGSNTYKNIISKEDFTILGTGLNYSQIIANANTAASLNLSVNTTELTFTKSNDGYYYSNVIEIQTNGGYEIPFENTKFISETVSKEENKYKFKIKESDIVAGTTETLKLTVKSTEASYIAQNYNCGSGVQTVTLNQIVKKSIAPIEITGSITREPEKGKIIINKTDSNNNPLVGATILITGASTGYNERYTTDGNPKILTDLEYDEYTIEEETAPEGYAKAQKQTVTISKTNLEQTVNLVDNILKISILKVDESGKVLPGATLKFTDKDGKILKICGETKDKECKWLTTENEYVIERIPEGTYYVKEVSAPDTYDVSKDSIKVIVTSDGLVTINGKDIKGETIKFVNKKTRTEISKVSAVDGKELPGATIEILDANKEKMSCVILNNKGKKETLKECSWVSGEESTIIVGLSKGKYYMKETIAPEGYVLNEEMVEFEVKADGTVNKATMKNELEVVVPDTLSARSTLLIAISMFDIALGIGILTYVKKNKAEE